MKLITKKTAIVFAALVFIQSLFAVSNMSSVALARSTRIKTKIVNLRSKIRKSKGRIKLYKKRKKRFLKKMANIRQAIKPIPDGLLKESLRRNYAHIKIRARGCNIRVKAYRKSIKKYINRIKQLKAIASAKIITGKASWYGGGMREYSLCAAMRGFRGKRVKVTNLTNGKSVTVVINDYGPARWTGRVIDLSKASFSRLGSLGSGVLNHVRLEIY